MKKHCISIVIFVSLLIPACAGTFMSGQRYVAMNITTDPPGADVTDLGTGTHWGKTPTSRITWSGTAVYKAKRVAFELQFEMPGYKSATRVINLKPTHITKKSAWKNPRQVHVILEPITKQSAEEFTTEISISSDPTGASVYANEAFIGQTPITETVTWNSSSNRIELRFEKSGYGTERRVLTPKDGRIHVVLHRS